MHRSMRWAAVAVALSLWQGGGAPLPTLRLRPAPATAAPSHTSLLWGEDGERWDPAGRLPDFSFAGYRTGTKALPDVPVQRSVRDFGAKGDGVTDDTAAFKRALDQTTQGALFVPPGRYKLTDVLRLPRSRLVLRGAGPDRTVLMMMRSLKQLTGTAPYNGVAAITAQGAQKGGTLTSVTAPARRGDRTLTVASSAKLQAGQWVRVQITNPSSNSLGCYLYAGQGCLNKERQAWFGGHIVDWVVQVAAVQGSRVTLARPLRVDLRPEWRPTLAAHQPSIEEVGVEDLTIAFPETLQYQGHGTWQGYYGIALLTVYNSWVRNVRIVDADRGVEIAQGGYNTVTDLTLTTQGRRPSANPTGDGTTGHYGVALWSLTQDNLVTDSTLETVYDHNLAVSSFANGNVFSRITTESGRFDSHGGAPYDNLYTQIIIRKTPRDLFKSGGNRRDEPSSGIHTTLWNIVALAGSWPPSPDEDFTRLNLIGVDLPVRPQTDPQGDVWIEPWPGEQTEPPNLYEAQFRRRLGRPTPPPDDPDADRDGLTDAEEREVYKTSPTDADTDNDGLQDGAEVAFWGKDWDDDADGDGQGNLFDADADNDGVSDGEEVRRGTNPGVTDVTPPPGDVKLWIEAEQPTALTSPMIVGQDAQASNQAYIWAPNGAGNFWEVQATNARGDAVYRFTVPVDGSYVFWGRVVSDKQADNSFFVSVDNAAFFLWRTPWGDDGDWVWAPMSPTSSVPKSFPLQAGTHELRLKLREDGTKLDRILITNAPRYVP